MKAIFDFFGAVLMLALVIAFGFLLGWSFNQWNTTLPAAAPACAEDEYRDLNGICVHVDAIIEKAGK